MCTRRNQDTLRQYRQRPEELIKQFRTIPLQATEIAMNEQRQHGLYGELVDAVKWYVQAYPNGVCVDRFNEALRGAEGIEHRILTWKHLRADGLVEWLDKAFERPDGWYFSAPAGTDFPNLDVIHNGPFGSEGDALVARREFLRAVPYSVPFMGKTP